MAYKYVDDIANIISEQVDIVSVIGSRVPLKRAGRNYKGLCPFHSEKTPSFTVSSERQSYYCFGCQKGGGVINFLMDYENLDFITAIETLADQQGIDLARYLAQTDEPAKDYSKLYELNRQAARYFYRAMKQSEKARNYFKQRGLSDETVFHFGLGFAPDSWNGLIHAMSPKFSLKTLEQVGLTAASKGREYDRFRARVMFPILDLRKRVIGFGGRVLSDQQPKYLNSPDSVIFNKGYHLYGLFSAKDYLGPEKRVLLVEGYMDVISLYQHGVKNAVASLGTAFTEHQAKLIRRFADSAVILYDGDRAGQQATKRALAIFFGLDFPVYVVTIPEGDDPDTYIVKHGQAAFEQFVKDNMTDGYTYLLNLAKQDLDLTQISGQRSYLQQALTIIKPIQDDMIKQVYLNQISHDIGLPVEEIIRTPIKQPAPTSKADDFRATLLSLLLQELDVTKQMRQHPFYDELPGAWKQLIEFIISENGYNIDLAIERFPLDVCAVFDQRRREAVSPKDRQNWPVLLRQLLVEQIEQDIRRINQDQNLSQEEKLKQVINKQKKIALLWNKETQ